MRIVNILLTATYYNQVIIPISIPIRIHITSKRTVDVREEYLIKCNNIYQIHTNIYISLYIIYKIIEI